MEIQASLPCFCVIIKTLFGAKIPPPHLKIHVIKSMLLMQNFKCIGLNELQKKLNETIVYLLSIAASLLSPFRTF